MCYRDDEPWWSVVIFYGMATVVISGIVFLSGWAFGSAWGWW